MKTRPALAIVPALAAAACAQTPPAPATPPVDWRALEAPVLTHHTQLTSRDQFLRAGEAYFGQGDWIIFQAVPTPEHGKAPDPFYSMYVAKLTHDKDGRISGTERTERISPPGSYNTCGWFHPQLPGTVMFASTLDAPTTEQPGGFNVKGRTYTWMFPKETEIVTVGVRDIFTDVVAKNPAHAPKGQAEPKVLFSRPDYDAECSFSKDGRFVLYAHVREDHKPGERADADIWIYDTETKQQHAIVAADGYDGGPFFSPDGKRICYRSDRKKNDLLQLFIADLKFENGVPVGISREYQLTDNEAVNWAPFWHPSGKFLVYGTSEIGHDNYEVFAIEIDDAKLAADGKGSRAADTLRHQRITYAPGADLLPAFSADGKTLMWTGQRGPIVAGEQKPSSQMWVADFDARGLFGSEQRKANSEH